MAKPFVYRRPADRGTRRLEPLSPRAFRGAPSRGARTLRRKVNGEEDVVPKWPISGRSAKYCDVQSLISLGVRNNRTAQSAKLQTKDQIQDIPRPAQTLEAGITTALPLRVGKVRRSPHPIGAQ